MPAPAFPLRLVACPKTRAPLEFDATNDSLVTRDGACRYPVNRAGIPLFAQQPANEDARRQQQHYDNIAAAYIENLSYPHTQEYFAYIDRALFKVLDKVTLGTMAEICCGRGEALRLLAGRYAEGVGIDISEAMLTDGKATLTVRDASLLQGDATCLPLRDAGFDSVVMLGGIHHVNDRVALFSEIRRILKPGGVFIFREPVSDFFLWKALRKIVYRLSPALDHETERPLERRETLDALQKAGLACDEWKTYGFFGFCLFMNSDILVVNRLFRFIPGIRVITRAFAKLDDLMLKMPGMGNMGLQVIGRASKPA